MRSPATTTALHATIALATLTVWSHALAQQAGRAEIDIPENCIKTHWAADCGFPRRDLMRPSPPGPKVTPPAGRHSDAHRDDPHRCITEPVWMESHLGPSCTMYAVYNHCPRPVHIKTCSYQIGKRRWDCEVRTGVQPGERKTHTNCSPIRDRYVDVIWADDRQSRLPDPPLPQP